MRMSTRLMAIVLVAAAVAGCSRRHCVPEEISANRRLVDLSAAPDAHAPVDPEIIRDVEAEFRKRITAKQVVGARPYNFLALSGGGMYGAFGVGVLTGWTDTG